MEIAVFGMYLLGVFTGFYLKECYLGVKEERAAKRKAKLEKSDSEK